MARETAWPQLHDEHRQALERFVADVERLPEASWAASPAEGKWSPGQIAEHVFLTYEALLRELGGGAGMRLRRLPWWRRQVLRTWYLPRILRQGRLPHGAPAVRELRPDEPRPRAATVAGLRADGQRFETELDAARARAEARALTHPFFGALSLPQVLRFVAVHIEHHRRQLPRLGAPTPFVNVYADERRAESYAGLDWPGTYALARNALREVIPAHVKGGRALDFGCGAGRSTRLLREMGFDVVGVDVSEEMLRRARARDPGGDYRLLDVASTELPREAFDLVLSAFTFDNVPLADTKARLFGALGRSLRSSGRIVSLVSAPEIYVNEWASFTTRDYPENREARSGERVRIVMTDVADRRPVEDVVFGDEDYQDVYRRAGLVVVEARWPLARGDEGVAWVSETRIAPWVVYVLRAARGPDG